MGKHGETRLANALYLALGIAITLLAVGWVLLSVAAFAVEGMVGLVVLAAIVLFVTAMARKDKREGVKRY